jgi:hypothetical protein
MMKTMTAVTTIVMHAHSIAGKRRNNMEIPHYNTWLKAVHVDHSRGTALVKSHRTGKSFPVTMKKDIRYLVHQGDLLHVIKSHVTGEWTAIDYNAITGGEVQ